MITIKVGAQSSTLFVADSLYQIGNYSKAIAEYEKLDANSAVFAKIANAYKALGNPQKALKNYEKAAAIDATQTLVLYEYGKLLFSEGEWEHSKEIFRKLQTQDSLNPNFYYYIGLAEESLSDEKYVQSYQKAFQLDAQHQKSIHKLIKYYIETSAIDKAENLIAIGLKNNSNDVKIIGFVAQLAYAQKNYKKALQWFDKLIEQQKATQYVYEKAAFSAYRTGKILKSIAYYEAALKRDQGNYFYHSQLAKLYYQDGIADKAEHHASQAIAGKMTDPSGDYYILGMVHLDRKERRKAIQFFKLALAENPAYELAQFRLAQSADGYYSDADEKLKMYENFIEKFPNGNTDVRNIVNTRISELKEEIHLKGIEKN